MRPLLSIIIANYNYGRFIDEAIQSVLSQLSGYEVKVKGEGERRRLSFDDVELIVIDGDSTDNSVEVIKKYAKGLPAGTRREDPSIVHLHLSPSPITYWVSEKDKGQSDAFNKGFAKATGRFLTWLNADDVMLPGTIEKLKIAAEKHPDCEWFVGGVFWLDPQMRIVNCGRGRPFSKIRYREGNVSVWGPSSFFTKRLLDAVGGVDERFHYTMDTDLWLRFACKQNARYLPFCDYAWGLRLHPDAKMSGHNFTADGKFDTKHSEAEKLKSSKHRAQMLQEGKWIAEYFHARKGNSLTRLLSVCWPKALAARLDLLRYRGQHYMEYFK